MLRDDPPPEVGRGQELLPGYLAVARLAHGRRLDTWDAFDLDRGTRCVVKVLRADRTQEADVAAAVLREGEILASLAHPHLVRCFDVRSDPRPAIVLETLRGATVSALIDQGPLAVPDTAMLGLQLASVLAYLHRHHWLHLDVKPENVVAEHGKAVLIDLSLAGRPGDGRPGAGTAGYMAPEQARGRGLCAATDVYGLGVTLWECLSGQPPYGSEQSWGSSPARGPLGRHRLRRRQADERRVRTPLPPTVPADLAETLTAAVSPDAAARPGLRDLDRVLLRHADSEDVFVPPEKPGG